MVGAETTIRVNDEDGDYNLGEKGTNKYYTIQRAMVGQCFGDADYSWKRPRTSKAVVASAKCCYIEVSNELIDMLKISLIELKFDLRTIAELKDRHWTSLMRAKDSKIPRSWPAELDILFGLDTLEKDQVKKPLEKTDLATFEYKRENKGILRVNPKRAVDLGNGKYRFIDLGLKYKLQKREVRPPPQRAKMTSSSRVSDMLGSMLKKFEKGSMSRSNSEEYSKDYSFIKSKTLIQACRLNTVSVDSMEKSTTVGLPSLYRSMNYDEISIEMPKKAKNAPKFKKYDI